MKTVLVAGSANLDLVVRTPRLPLPGETVLGRDFAAYPGGKGANQAVASARAGGVPTRMLLALGDDANAAVLETSLEQAGVQRHVVRVPMSATGVALIAVGEDGENSIVVASGANQALRPEHLPSLEGVGHLLMQLETPADSVSAWARQARAAGVTVVLNAAPAPERPTNVLSDVDVLVVNEVELAQCSPGDRDVQEAMQRLGVPHVVVTLGALGCLALTPQGLLRQSSFDVEVVDTTAAGDTFCGALVAALAQRLPWPDALRRACAAAALACTRAGAQSSIPDSADVDRLLRNGREAVPPPGPSKA